MANQQLVDYIKGQMTAGVSEADIKKILKDAGWPDAEMEDGFKVSRSSSSMAAVAASPAIASQPTSAKPMETAKTEPKKESMTFDFMSNPGGASSMTATTSKPKENKPFFAAADKASAPAGKSISTLLPWIIAGVALVLGIGASVYFSMQGGSSASALASLTAQNDSLSSQLAALKNTSLTSASALDAAKADAAELLGELNLFVNSGVSTSTPAKFDLRGTIGSVKSQYTLTTSRGVMLTVKNSKDAKVDAALKPLIGGTGELSGTHVIGTYEITVEQLNGAPFITPVVATSTAPASTSTAPAATSTGQ